ncbi:hypothetical protein QBC46DRAFT_412943 [Diplogelasinospora grovesii]|uniref:Uncharacterized protein n=1 Tax=Diplogelasinospora grovesii TaxID=303347 RepID=A0AAN6RZE7_9PEZI|nr:hypothetical protein QBC46DRAFT_412943 [Diplogelasinospora grovesii]
MAPSSSVLGFTFQQAATSAQMAKAAKQLQVLFAGDPIDWFGGGWALKLRSRRETRDTDRDLCVTVNGGIDARTALKYYHQAILRFDATLHQERVFVDIDENGQVVGFDIGQVLVNTPAREVNDVLKRWITCETLRKSQYLCLKFLFATRGDRIREWTHYLNVTWRIQFYHACQAYVRLSSGVSPRILSNAQHS